MLYIYFAEFRVCYSQQLPSFMQKVTTKPARKPTRKPATTKTWLVNRIGFLFTCQLYSFHSYPLIRLFSWHCLILMPRSPSDINAHTHAFVSVGSDVFSKFARIVKSVAINAAFSYHFFFFIFNFFLIWSIVSTNN